MYRSEESPNVEGNEHLFHSSYNSLSAQSVEHPQSDHKLDENPLKRYTSKQWITLLLLSFSSFCISTSIALQGPFFPKEAEAKGATPTQYGQIFGIYQLAIFTASPIMGKLIAHVEPKFVLNSGIFVIGVATILFGTLNLAPNGFAFVSLAFAIRIVDGIGTAAFRTSCYVTIASQLKEKMSTTFGIVQSFVGIGFIIGPTLGGALYDLGGYGLPFFVIGAVILVDCGLIFFLLPNAERTENKDKSNILKFWLDPGTLIYSFVIFTTYNYTGFNTLSLEPHLREFNLSGTLVGVMFSFDGAVYALSAIVWGWMSDRKMGNKKLVLSGCCFMIVSQLFIGPMPFFKMESGLAIIIVALLFMGLGMGAKSVCAFSGSLEHTITRGFPPDLNTYGLISSMYNASLALGAFVGPSLGGYLIDSIGYRMTTLVLLCLEILLILAFLIYAFVKRGQHLIIPNEEEKKLLARSNYKEQSYS